MSETKCIIVDQTCTIYRPEEKSYNLRGNLELNENTGCPQIQIYLLPDMSEISCEIYRSSSYSSLTRKKA